MTEKPEELSQLTKGQVEMIIHDLKGPTSELIANLDMLGTYISDEIGGEILLTASNSADELLEMIQDILDVSKMEEGELKINPVKIDIVKLVKSKAAKVQGLAMRANKTLIFNSALETYETEGDEDIVGRVLWNLISNANNHTSSGGAIKITINLEDEKLKISVSDDGTGISQESLDHIFDKFYQSEKLASNKYSSGLGLTFCKMAVEAHGWRIGVESEYGKGTTFSIYLS